MPAQVEEQAPFGRRERKKRETRDALIEAALDLFTRQGVDRTTIEQIADRADVSERTFYRYFATKEDVLFADGLERQEQFAAALAARPANEPLLDGLRVAAQDLAASMIAHADHSIRRQQVIETSDALQARYLRLTEEWAALVSEHAARRLGMRADDALPRLLGSCVIATVRTTRATWIQDPSLDIATEVDRCFRALGNLTEATTMPRRRRRP